VFHLDLFLVCLAAQIWGNATWAPDDTPAMRAAGRSYGSLITAARLVKVPSSASSGQQGDGFTANETETQSGDLPEVELGITSQSEQAAVQTARTPSAAHSQEQGGGGAADSSSSGDSSSLSSLSNAMSAATITAALRRLLGVGDDEEVRMSDLVHLDVSAAIRTALAASGPLAARKYRKWGAVHARAIQKQKGKVCDQVPLHLLMPSVGQTHELQFSRSVSNTHTQSLCTCVQDLR
jgi:hypothetical protein